jgi:hypothetical protein
VSLAVLFFSDIGGDPLASTVVLVLVLVQVLVQVLVLMLHARLSQMILDQVFYGVLNESVGTLEVYDEPQEDVSAI